MKAATAAVIGVGNTNYGDLYYNKDAERSDFDLAVDSFTQAVDDAGIDKHTIDAVLCMRVPSYVTFCDRVGLRHVQHTNFYEGDGRFSGMMIQHAVMLIETGVATTVACVYGNNGRSVAAKYGGEPRPNSPQEYDMMFGMTSPGAYVSMMYNRYCHLYGAPKNSLAPLGVNNRKNAALNPDAVMRNKPITLEEYENARFIAEPMRLFDYALINDGGVTVIVTRADRAKDAKTKPVYIRGAASAADLYNFYTSKDFFFAAGRNAAEQTYESSGLGPKDAKCVQIYDNFTPTILFSLESFNYCERGEAWQWVRDGRIEIGGEKPINTSGGHTAESYMQGWGHIVEAIRQVRGECGPRQVVDCDIAHYLCLSPIVTSMMFCAE